MESQVHISVFKKNNIPQVTRCTVCCTLYHCPLCPTSIYKPRCKAKVLQHLEVHVKNALQHEDFYITKCHQDCRSGGCGHFHCPVCLKTVIRRESLTGHLQFCRPPSKQGDGQGNEVKTTQEEGAEMEVTSSEMKVDTAAAYTDESPADTTPLKEKKEPNVSKARDQVAEDDIEARLATEAICTEEQGTVTTPIRKKKRNAPAPEGQEGAPAADFRKPQESSSLGSPTDNPPSRVQRAKPPTVLCPHCNMRIGRKSIKKHVFRKHTDKAVRDITASSHLDAVCIYETIRHHQVMSEGFLMEVCVDSVESAINAENGGAGRLELCSSLLEGGLTPSVGLLQVVKQHVKIPICVMIRPRGGDFLYSDQEVEVMKRDIELMKSNGADGLVLGALTEDGQVATELCLELLALSHPLPVTFHRAFDMVDEPEVALETLVSLGFQRLLTSGCDSSALEGLPLIKRLVEQAKGRIAIMPGGGITERNLQRILKGSGAQEFHCSARSSRDSAMRFRNSRVTMGASFSAPEYGLKVADVSRVCGLNAIARNAMSQ